MIRVRDEARSVDFYRRAFGMQIAGRFQFDAFTLVYLKADESPFELELTINQDRSDPYVQGDGYGHIAFAVRDLDAEHKRFEWEGLSPLPVKEFHRGGA